MEDIIKGVLMTMICFAQNTEDGIYFQTLDSFGFTNLFPSSSWRGKYSLKELNWISKDEKPYYFGTYQGYIGVSDKDYLTDEDFLNYKN